MKLRQATGYRALRAAMMLGIAPFALTALPASAQAQQAVSIDIPAQSLATAIRQVGRQTRTEIIFSAAAVGARRAPAVRGSMTASDALARLLSGTGLTVRAMPEGALLVEQAEGNALGGAIAADERATAADEAADPIVVTGTRIDRAGYDAPTPTTVIGAAELAQGARANVGEVLNDLPSFRPTTTPMTTVGNVGSGTIRPDLRGLGTPRTLVLLNGHRFSGSSDLNNVPMNLVKRIDVVTGGASAAWGSGAVAGVANIILDDSREGLEVGAKAGISSRGDGARYGLDASFGTHFADGRGHFMISADYLDSRGIPDRHSRPNLGSTATFVNPAYTPTNGQHQYIIMPDVNVTNAGRSGLILSGVLAGQTFNADGTLRPFQFGSPRNSTAMVGGADGWNTYDGVAVMPPSERIGTFARASFEISEAAKIWVEGSYTRMSADYNYFPDSDRAITIRNDNAFLSQAIRDRMAAAGQTSFTMGRWFQDRIYQLRYQRENIEAAIGISGKLGGSWNYSVYYDHGEAKDYNGLSNLRIRTNYANAVDAVTSPTTGKPICRIALTNPSTNCVPVNLFGEGNISDPAAAYIYGTAVLDTTTKLDTTGASLRGDPFSLWAGPVSIAIGVEARWESIDTKVDPISTERGFVSSNRSPTIGSFSVKEGFAEIAVPLIDVADVNKLEFNAAARYSDYSNTGGIWSWKVGATDRLFNDLLLRATYSRDIRSGNMSELFTSRSTSISNVVDPKTNTSVQVTTFVGGNPRLAPERANTLTIGGSYAPRFIPGFNLSVDYYNIKIRDVITIITGQDTLTRCANGNAALCALITRNAAGAITSIEASYINLARYETRGVDIEASYTLPLDRIGAGMGGSLRFRALATYVDSLITDDLITRLQAAGTVGDNTNFGTPKWRVTGNLGYEGERVGANLRVRYVGGGVYSRSLDIENNAIAGRTYVDLGLRFDVGGMTLSADVNNLFDRDAPLSPGAQAHYDVIGRYFNVGARIRF